MGCSVRQGIQGLSDAFSGGRFRIPASPPPDEESGKSDRPVLYSSFAQSSGASVEQGGPGRGSGQEVFRLLQPAFPGPQTLRRGPPGHRPVGTEPTSVRAVIQDGNPSISKTGYSPRGVGGVAGHQGRVPACADGQDCPKVSEIHGSRKGVPVQDFTFRSFYEPSRVYQALRTGGAVAQTEGCEGPRVFRRLVNQVTFPGPDAEERPVGPATSQSPGVDCQRGKVASYPSADLHFSGHDLRHHGGSGDGFSFSGVHREACSSATDSQRRSSHGPAGSFVSRPGHVSGPPDSERDEASQSHPMGSEGDLATSLRPMVRCSMPSRSSVERHQLVHPASRFCRSSGLPTGAYQVDVYRRIEDRMGGQFGVSQGQWTVGSSGFLAQQSQRDASSGTSFVGFRPPSDRSSRADSHRQPHSGVLHPSEGRHQVEVSQRPCPQSLGFGGRSSHSSSPCVDECGG